MSLFLRIFSSDYRAGVAAEASGDFTRAAQLYALANAKNKVAEMHMLRRGSANGDQEEINLLREAVRWALDGTDLARIATRKLGQALLRRAEAQGVASERDRRCLREAARLFEKVDSFEQAGDIHESLGDDEAAGKAYGRGGLVEKMETALARVTERNDLERRVRDAFQEYEVMYQCGDRPAAREALRVCADAAHGDYGRLVDRLEGRWLAEGRLRLRRAAPEKHLSICGVNTVRLGRDPACELSLRAPNVSRQHASIAIEFQDDRGVFTLTDLGSRTGTWLGGMPVSGSLPLTGSGQFSLGKECTLDFSTDENGLLLVVSDGLDQGTTLLCGPPNVGIDIEPALGMSATIRFTDSMPVLRAKDNKVVVLNGEAIVGDPHLLREDQVRIEHVQVTVL